MGDDLKSVLEKLEKQHASEWGELLNSDEGDRTIAVVTVCVLDDLLKKLIKENLIKDRRVDVLFKDEHLLQSTYAKINIAYFLGLIPSIWRDDLITLNRIRNQFAHTGKGSMTFDHDQVYKLLLNIKMGPRNLGADRKAKWRFVLTAQQLIDFLLYAIHSSEETRTKKLTELLDLEKRDWETGLTKENIEELEEKGRMIWFKTNTPGKLGKEVICVKKIAKLEEPDLVVCKVNNGYTIGTVRNSGNAKYVVTVEDKIKFNDCEVIGKVVKKIINYS